MEDGEDAMVDIADEFQDELDALIARFKEKGLDRDWMHDILDIASQDC